MSRLNFLRLLSMAFVLVFFCQTMRIAQAKGVKKDRLPTATPSVGSVQADDGLFIGAGGKTYSPAVHSVGSVPAVKPHGFSLSAERIWFINGIDTKADNQYETMQLIADRTHQEVIGIRNATEGPISDIGQAAEDLFMPGNNLATKTLRDAVLSELDSDNEVHLFAHSQGTIIVNNALKDIIGKLKARGLGFCEILDKLNLIKIENYGSPVKQFVDGPSYIHYCNKLDPFCNLALGAAALKVVSLIPLARPVVILARVLGAALEHAEETANYGGNALIISLSPGAFNPHAVREYLTDRINALPFPPAPHCTAELFLFDTSGSMADAGKWDGGLSSLLELLKNYDERNKAHQEYFQISIMSFAGECSTSNNRTLFEFTSDVKTILNGLPRALPRPGGGTPLMLSLEVALDKLDEFKKKNPSIPESGVCLITDGEDTCGQIRPDTVWGNGGRGAQSSALRSMVPANTRINAIGYDLAPGSRGERDLQYMSFVTGGRYYNAADPRQLRRAIQKTTQSYFARPIVLAEAQSTKFRETADKAAIALQKKNSTESLKLYRQLEAGFKRDGVNSAELYFNVAQALEANDRYKGAIEYYQLYLKNNPQAADRALIEQKMIQLKQDYKDQFEYYLKIIESDLAYLKKYYETLFNQRNEVLASDFAGFVTEKGEFYTNLQDVLEVSSTELKNHAKDLSDGLYNLSDRVNSKSFDRDAVSLLTVPISELEEILELLKNNKARLTSI